MLSRTIRLLLVVLAIGSCANVWGASYQVKHLTSDLHIPVAAVMAPGIDDKIFIAQLGGVAADGSDGNDITKADGRIVIYDRNTGQVNYLNPFLAIGDTSLHDPFGVPEVGLFSFAFHPEFQTNGKFYVNVAVNHVGPAPMVDTRISPFKTVVREYTVDVNNPALPILSSRSIFELAQPAANHNGTWIGFSPQETDQGKHYLYVTQGDGGDQHDPANYGQNIDSWFGKVMRVDVDGDDFPADATKNYAIPADNPYVGQAGADELWAIGLRNPWRASFDRETSDFWIGDVGQGWYEEVDFQAANSPGGDNYGWRLQEGAHNTPTGGVGGPAPVGHDPPVYEYLHSNRPGGDPDFKGNSVTGGYVYRGPIQELYGRYFFADNVSGHIWSLDPSDPYGSVQLMDTLFTPDQGSIIAISSFGEDEQGNLLIVDGAGSLFAVLPNLQITLTVDRDSGSLTITNESGASTNILGYSVTSAAGAIDPLHLTPIAGNYDAPPGNGSVDPTNSWTVLSASGDNYSFSEESDGTAATLADGQDFSLSAVDGWTPSPTEDLIFSVTLGDGSTVSASVEYVGNNDVPFTRSDLSFDGELTLADWAVFHTNHLSNLASLSPAQQYGRGDLDGDGDNDYFDFLIFRDDYDLANGQGAFADLFNVPEPATSFLAIVGLLMSLSVRRRN